MKEGKRKREKERERERERGGGDGLYQLATFEQRQLFLTLEQGQSKIFLPYFICHVLGGGDLTYLNLRLITK